VQKLDIDTLVVLADYFDVSIDWLLGRTNNKHMLVVDKSDFTPENPYSHAPYYTDQTGWVAADYYQLNRYLNRLLTFAARRMDEIDNINLEKMSTETKVLLYVLIQFQRKYILLEKPNLSDPKNQKPLKKRLNLVDNPIGIHELYTKFNIGW